MIGALRWARAENVWSGSLLRVVANAHRRPRPPDTGLVSVVIATYNWSSVLAHAVASALAQTYPRLEVIVVGDGCTDDSEAVVRAIGDERVRWENLPVNSGSQSMPNNRGIELARGEYVAYLGHDDLWHPEHLSRLVAAIEASGKGLAVATMIVLGGPGSNYSRLATTSFVTPSAVLHRRAAVERVGPWRDYRTIVRPPDEEFLTRVVASQGVVHTYALTLWKFPSVLRRDSYVVRGDAEQAAYARRIGHERLLVEREIAGFLWLRLSRAKRDLPEFDPVPAELPPGWHVRQFRRVRGLPEDPDT